MKKILLLIIIIFSILAAPVFADTIIVNSKDWRDVYSGMQYGYLTGNTPKFLVSEKHSTLVLGELNKEEKIEALSSKTEPYVVVYRSIIESNGFDADETILSSFNIDLAKRLTDIDNYIIIDDVYGYNAISVSTYAILTKSYVIFARRDNIAEVSSFLSSRKVGKVLIYGYVDREVRQALNKYSPEIINKDNDKFENNVEIVRRCKALKEFKQVTLTNGEFIEADIMAGSYPILFIGRQNVPVKVAEYIKSSDIEVGVLVGNDLFDSAVVIRRQTGISTFIKFARSPRENTEEVGAIEGLDLFPIPKVEQKIVLDSIKYNSLSKQIYVTIRNDGEAASYFKGTYAIKADGKEFTIGDSDMMFIEGKTKKTLFYDIEPITDDSYINATVFVLFGESKNSLEYKLEGSVLVSSIEVNDDSEIEIVKAEYSKNDKRLYVTIKNIGSSDVYVNTEATDVFVIDSLKNLGSTSTLKISPGSSKDSIIKADLSNEDLSSNENIKVRAYYGKSEDSLAKLMESSIKLSIRSFDPVVLLPLVIIGLLIIIMVVIKMKKRRN